ncbi:MAG: hypothetical protein AVDCRST_MAG68-4028 [uncultured Gemmatimonadetes bacterium]|uniref:PEGA domain-containing protein n=1 Tax=uncultured Gemmatimonadota bacterium TaxID=203437 RepID=A0A6J4M386_9BACT|nr:MAG: hypothetical protein AVDCRST_MAG68-4028 [uncultured Gemmatimonadota bacterium]
MLRYSLLAAALVLVTAGTSGAQERAPAPAPVAAGARVRITVPVFVDGYELSGGRATPRVGTLMGVDSTSVTVRLDRDGSLLTAPLRGVSHLEVSRGAVTAGEGRSRGVRRGAMMGAGVGLVGAAVFTLIEFAQDDFNEQTCGGEFEECANNDAAFKPATFALSTGVGAAAGAVIGLALGARARERWERVPVGSLRVGTAGAGTRVGVSLRL